MAKVQSLSNAVHRRPMSGNDTVEDIAGKTLLKPTCTRLCTGAVNTMLWSKLSK